MFDAADKVTWYCLAMCRVTVMIARLLLMDIHTESLIILCILNAYLSCNFPVDVVIIVVIFLLLSVCKNREICIFVLVF